MYRTEYRYRNITDLDSERYTKRTNTEYTPHRINYPSRRTFNTSNKYKLKNINY